MPSALKKLYSQFEKVDLAFWAELREEGLFSEVKCNMMGGVPKQVLGVLVGYFSNQSRGHAV